MSLLVLTDDQIRALLQNPTIVAEFSFLKAAAAPFQKKEVKKGCKCASKNRASSADYSGIRAAIAQMPAERKLRFKQLLGVDNVRIRFSNSRRNIVKMTF